MIRQMIYVMFTTDNTPATSLLHHMVRSNPINGLDQMKNTERFWHHTQRNICVHSWVNYLRFKPLLGVIENWTTFELMDDIMLVSKEPKKWSITRCVKHDIWICNMVPGISYHLVLRLGNNTPGWLDADNIEQNYWLRDQVGYVVQLRNATQPPINTKV